MTLALAMTSLLMLIAGSAMPVISVWSYGIERHAYLWSNVSAYWRGGFPSLGALVAAFCVFAPFTYLSLFVFALLELRTDPHAGLGKVFRWVKHLRLWAMLDVFLVGGFVAYSRLGVIAEVQVGLGGWCLIVATFAGLLAMTQFDERVVWSALTPRGPAMAAIPADPVACMTCDLVVDRAAHPKCPRCSARLAFRKPSSMQVTAALVIASFLLYVPANLLPVLSITQIGGEQNKTIMSGVLELADNDLVPLAILVFAASVVLPMLKLIGLSWMLLATRSRSAYGLLVRTRLYRLVDAIGRWSNIDVFMGSILAALLQFGALSTLRPKDGLVAFAAVVVLTMIATSTFDTRLMWDATKRA